MFQSEGAYIIDVYYIVNYTKHSDFTFSKTKGFLGLHKKYE